MCQLIVHKVPFFGTVSTRNLLIVGLLALVLAACEPVTAPTTTTATTTPGPLPPPDLNGSAPTTAEPPATMELPGIQYQGVLPNGTDYSTRIPGLREESLTLITGTFNRINGDDLSSVGEVRYTRVTEQPNLGFFGNTLRLWDSNWLVEVTFDPLSLEQLESMPEVNVNEAIQLQVLGGFPQLSLSEPFTWAGADPQIRYESFVVATGCWSEAARCTENHAVQVLSSGDVFIGAGGLNDFQVEAMTLDSTSMRSAYDPNYLDPGPLSPRNSASVVWTGEEMIVWGGKEGQDGVPGLIDGAAFNPETNQWRMLARFPYLGSFGARAIWGDGEMLVVSSEGTLAYDPDGDSWREIGEALIPPEYNDRMLYLHGVIYVWDRAFSMHRMDIDVGMWETIDAPDAIAGFSEAWAGVLRVVNHRLVAITLTGACQGKQFWQLEGDVWGPLPDVELGTAEYADCSNPRQSVSLGDDLFIWDDLNHPTMALEAASNEWREVSPAPLGGDEGAAGAVTMNADQFMVPEYGRGAMFDVRTEEWTEIILPGNGTDAEIVWTGEEFLAWGIDGSFDAWRFRPPPGFAGGDDTS